MQQPQAGLEIRALVPSWLAVLSIGIIYIFKPKLSVDGSQAIDQSWGDNLVPMTPGRHMVSYWWPLYWFIPANRAQLVIDIQPGQVAQLQYSPRWFWFLEGIMQQVGVRGMLNQPGAIAAPQMQAQPQPQQAAQPAGWHPDPSGRHEMRYWSGSGWTDDVSDRGVTTKDPAG